MLTFAWPWVVVLIPLPLVVQRLVHHLGTGRERLAGTTDAIAIPPRLAEALNATGEETPTINPLQALLPWVCWLLLLAALSQPSIPGSSVIQPASGRAMALVVDLSGSMERKDFQIDGEDSDRLSVVKQVAGDFVEKRQGDRLSLILFGKQAFVASPLTFDLTAVRHALQSAGIGMAGRSTAIGDALGLALQTLRNDPAPDKAIILLSDGTNNAGSVEPESAAELAATLAVRIHTIALGSDSATRVGLGTTPSADLDEAALEAIARSSGGLFKRARTLDELADVYAAIDSLEQAEAESPPVILQNDIRNPLLMALLLCLLFHELAYRWRR